MVANYLHQSKGFSRTDANAFIDRGRMFVFGDSHVELLFNGQKPKGNAYLDVGAGDGSITKRFSGGFEKTIALEMSQYMVQRLKEKGFITSKDANVLFDETIIGKNYYDLVSMFNVLDRADKPISMLKALKSCVKKDGRILLAVVLPFCPFVEQGVKKVKPVERLNLPGICKKSTPFEYGVTVLDEFLRTHLGLEVEKWSKLPYISEGDYNQNIYVLENAILLLKKSTTIVSSNIINSNHTASNDENDEQVISPNFDILK